MQLKIQPFSHTSCIENAQPMWLLAIILAGHFWNIPPWQEALVGSVVLDHCEEWDKAHAAFATPPSQSLWGWWLKAITVWWWRGTIQSFSTFSFHLALAICWPKVCPHSHFTDESLGAFICQRLICLLIWSRNHIIASPQSSFHSTWGCLGTSTRTVVLACLCHWSLPSKNRGLVNLLDVLAGNVSCVCTVGSQSLFQPSYFRVRSPVLVRWSAIPSIK